MVKLNQLLFLLFLLFSSSCSHYTRKWVKAGIIPENNSFEYVLDPLKKDSIKILYTGCGGIVIAKGKEGIITDPYFTGHGLLRVKFGKIKIDTNNTKYVMKQIAEKVINPIDISTALIAHSHYDHLEDLPYLMENKLLSPRLKITGGSSTYCTIQKFMQKSYSYLNADTFCYRQNPSNIYNRFWDTVSEHIRVLTIEASHAPHVGKYISYMQGSTCHKGLSDYTNSLDKSTAEDWKLGTTFSFLIDILDGKGGIKLRLFLQSSSCSPPYGMPPQELVNERKIDLAIIGVASAQNIEDYPDTLLKRLNTQHLMLIHWEDFFHNLYKSKVKSVPGTKIKPFLISIKTHYKKSNISDLKDFVKMPRPLSLGTVYY